MIEYAEVWVVEDRLTLTFIIRVRKEPGLLISDLHLPQLLLVEHLEELWLHIVTFLFWSLLLVLVFTESHVEEASPHLIGTAFTPIRMKHSRVIDSEKCGPTPEAMIQHHEAGLLLSQVVLVNSLDKGEDPWLVRVLALT